MSRTKPNLTDEITDLLTNYEDLNDEMMYLITRPDKETVLIEEESYRLVVDYREGFELEAFKGRYQDYLEKYDYIVGDWASDQLRLKGFYQFNTTGVPKNQTIETLQDYLWEHCNFGCRYFVLAKTAAVADYLAKASQFEQTLPDIKEQKMDPSRTKIVSKRQRNRSEGKKRVAKKRKNSQFKIKQVSKKGAKK